MPSKKSYFIIRHKIKLQREVEPRVRDSVNGSRRCLLGPLKRANNHDKYLLDALLFLGCFIHRIYTG